ncbi:MAG: hypothetical protein QNK05_08075 [Myxococcota bacterium]|nr:hypothetical protein [Myxococcota bacterium]
MSFPAQILVATALVSTFVAGASSAPGRVRSLGPGDRAQWLGMTPAELRATAARIEAATEVQLALERLGMGPVGADRAGLGAALEQALASLRRLDLEMAGPVSAGQVEQLLASARGLAAAELEMASARARLERALDSL